MAVNAAAPFLLCSRLKPLLAKAAAAATASNGDGGGTPEQNNEQQNGVGIVVPLLCAACVRAGKHLAPRGDKCDRCVQRRADCHPPRAQATGVRNDDRAGARRRAGVRYSHVINVSALEGKFNVGKKSTAHPHTNMGKAALNMMTHTCSRDFISSHVLVNCVDTGWVTDMAPLGIGAVAKTHKTHVGPPLDEEDGAARVTDPIYTHITEGSTEHGMFFKDYHHSSW